MLLLMTAGALAQGLSVDAQLIRPTLGEAALPGIVRLPGASPGMLPGVLMSADLEPVSLHPTLGVRQPVIESRFYAAPSLGWEKGRVRLSGSVPVAWQNPGDTLYSPDGGLVWGDPQVAATFTGLDRPTWKAGVHGRAYAPLGTRGVYMGEAAPRGAVSAVAERHGESLSLSAEAGVLFRAGRVSQADYRSGNELQAHVGGSTPLSSGLDVVWSLHWHSVPGSTGFEERSVEALLGLRGGGAGSLGMGRGLTRGLGTTRARMWLLIPGTARMPPMETAEPQKPDLNLQVERQRPQAQPGGYVEDRHLYAPKGPPQELVDLPGEDAPIVSSNGLAQVVDDEIQIREPILFEQGTANILPESQPVLDAVAELMAEHPELAHVAVVGHASVEGSHAHNYELSTRRAQSIYEALILAGVHPHRLSYRGMGEVEPLEGKAESRRVVFQIVQQLHPLQITPEYPEQTPLPWSGEEVPVTQPPPPSLPPEPEEEPLPDFSADDEDFELEVSQ